MPELVVNANRRQSEPLLFPGYQLDQRPRTIKEISCLTGALFESATRQFFQGSELLTTDGTTDVCPDAVNDDLKIFFESKAGAKDVKVCPFQLGDYRRVAAETGYSVFYCFWWYQATGLRKRFGTTRKIIEAVLESVVYLDILDIDIVGRMIEVCPPGVAERMWTGRSGGSERSQPYPVFWVSPTFMRRLRGDPINVLRHELGFDKGDLTGFDYRGQGSLRSTATLDGVSFSSADFIGWSFTRPERPSPRALEHDSDLDPVAEGEPF